MDLFFFFLGSGLLGLMLVMGENNARERSGILI